MSNSPYDDYVAEGQFYDDAVRQCINDLIEAVRLQKAFEKKYFDEIFDQVYNKKD